MAIASSDLVIPWVSMEAFLWRTRTKQEEVVTLPGGFRIADAAKEEDEPLAARQAAMGEVVFTVFVQVISIA